MAPSRLAAWALSPVRRLSAAAYDLFNTSLERNLLGPTRQLLLSDARGVVLEISSGRAPASLTILRDCGLRVVGLGPRPPREPLSVPLP